MDWKGVLNEINRQGTAVFDDLVDKGTKLVSNVTKPSQTRKAGEGFQSNPVMDYIKEIPNKGAIYVAAPTPEIRTGLGYVKSLMGDRGKIFRIGDNDKSNEFYQQTVDAATKTKDGKVIFNQNIADKDEYDRLGRNLSNKDIGRYHGTINDKGDVIVEDDYDTNNSVDWHLRRVLTGENAEGDPRPVGLSGRVISAASALHKWKQDAGKTNPRPFGHTVNMGNVNRNQQ